MSESDVAPFHTPTDAWVLSTLRENAWHVVTALVLIVILKHCLPTSPVEEFRAWRNDQASRAKQSDLDEERRIALEERQAKARAMQQARHLKRVEAARQAALQSEHEKKLREAEEQERIHGEKVTGQVLGR
mmetsp:Transcript_709/g.1358  ORF Transcript_709/g.1358 Transcript_709/m.1358 type:complete len:131 (-) Transcript_709:80-472(-)